MHVLLLLLVLQMALGLGLLAHPWVAMVEGPAEAQGGSWRVPGAC